MYPPDLKDEVCGVAGGGLLRLGWAGKCQLPEQKRQVHDTGKPSLTAEFNPTNPLEQGLGDRFFCPFRRIFLEDLAPPLHCPIATSTF